MVCVWLFPPLLLLLLLFFAGAQDPGRVYKGKKMAGRMGGDQRTTECLQVYKIDIKRNIVYVKGAVPGFNGSYVKVRDSLRKPHKTPPPFPTHKVTQDDVQLIMDLREGKKFDSPQQVRHTKPSLLCCCCYCCALLDELLGLTGVVVVCVWNGWRANTGTFEASQGHPVRA